MIVYKRTDIIHIPSALLSTKMKTHILCKRVAWEILFLSLRRFCPYFVNFKACFEHGSTFYFKQKFAYFDTLTVAHVKWQESYKMIYNKWQKPYHEKEKKEIGDQSDHISSVNIHFDFLVQN